MGSQTPRPRRATRTAYAVFLCALAGAFVAGPLVAGPAAAAADDSGAGVTHVEVVDGHLQVLVAVPPDVKVDLDAVTVQVDGTKADADAESAGGAGTVRRTVVLAIDSSSSM